MNKVLIKFFIVIVSFLFSPYSLLEASNNTSEETYSIDQISKEIKKESIIENNDLNVDEDFYILDKGDSILVTIDGYPELSKIYNINLDGNIYMPRLKFLNISGFTIKQLKKELTEKYSEFLLNADIGISIVTYRPIRIFIGGEVSRPGYYTLSNYQNTTLIDDAVDRTLSDPFGEIESQINAPNFILNRNLQSAPLFFPTVFDAIQRAEGITPFSDLSEIKVTRIVPESMGGGRKKTSLNFISLIVDGDDNQNIRLYDGDTIFVEKNDNVITDQIIKAGQTNLNPRFITIFITGRVVDPGRVKVPTGTSLNNAITLAGGTKLLKGKIEFIRFTNAGTIDKRKFNYSPNSKTNTYKNPILRKGDIVRVRESIVTSSLGVITEVTAPFVNVFSVYGFFDNFFDD